MSVFAVALRTEDSCYGKKDRTEGRGTRDPMRHAKYSLIAIALTLCFSLDRTLTGKETSGWSLEFRITADPTKDATIINKAKADANDELYEGNSLVAKWVPVFEGRMSDFLGHSAFVTRINNQRGIDLLVLISENDLTDHDISELGTTLDINGKIALSVRFKDTNPPKLLVFTKNNIGRQVAQIINGKVYCAPYINSALREQAIVTGDFSKDTIDNLLKECSFKLKEEYLMPPPYAITMTPLRIIIITIVLFLLILSSLPVRDLKKSKHPHSWIIASIIVGFFIGGYWLGVTKSMSTSGNQNGILSWGELTQVSILGILLGGFIGGFIGVASGYLLHFLGRRAIHNFYRLSRRFLGALLPSWAVGTEKTVPKKEHRRLNKKQSVVLWMSVFLILFFVLFPPWVGSKTKIITDTNPEGYPGEDYRFIGFHFLFPSETTFFGSGYIITRIDYLALLTLCSCTAGICVIFMLLLRNPAAKHQHS